MTLRESKQVFWLFIAGLMMIDPVLARGLGGFHGGGGGMRAMAGSALGGPGMRGMAGRMPAGVNLGGGSLLPGGLGPGALNPGALRSSQLGALESRFSGAEGGGISALENRLDASGGSIANRLPNLGPGPLSGPVGLSGPGPLSGKIPTNSQLSSFLGIPSDRGLSNLSGAAQGRIGSLADKLPEVSSDLGNRISGATQDKVSKAIDTVRSGDGAKALISGETQKPISRLYDQVRDNGFHPFNPWSPWSIHNHASLIRRDFNAYLFFTPAWYESYPYAWYPESWYYGSPWVWAPWSSISTWCGYPVQPTYYDYGNNIVMQDDSVLVNGDNVGTPEQYAQQAQQLATQGQSDNSASDKEWMSLGVFAVSQGEQQDANMVMQLAINKQGVIRGNYSNTTNKDTQLIHGMVDKKTLRAAWTVGKKTNLVLDTGIYNLTKDETSVLVHDGDQKTEQWLMVRIKQEDDKDPTNAASTTNANP